MRKIFETQLEKAAFSQKDERDRIIQDLANHPDDTLSEAIHVLNHPLIKNKKYKDTIHLSFFFQKGSKKKR